MRRRVFAVVAAVASYGCAEDDTSPLGDAGADTDAGPTICAPGTTATADGACRPAGIDEAGCAAGFAAADVGCVVLLPGECRHGAMALPGEPACREVKPCAAGPWGDVRVEAGAQHVLAGAPAATADGSATHPWPTIQAAVDAVASDGLVVIGAGSYAEAVVVHERVRIAGKCPAEVEIVGPAAASAAVAFDPGSGGSILSGVALTGGTRGVQVLALDVAIERVWIHDTANQGVAAQNGLGAASFVVRDSLVESATDVGVLAVGSSAIIERSVVRDTRPTTGGSFGRAVDVEYLASTGTRGSLEMASSVILRSREFGVYASGADATITASAVLDTLPGNESTGWGRAVNVRAHDSGERGALTITGSVLERSLEAGIYAADADVDMTATSIRDVAPAADGRFGRGIEVMPAVDGGVRPRVSVRGSVVERATEIGVFVAGCDVTLEGIVVRDVVPNGMGIGGRGISTQASEPASQLPHLTLRDSVVERTMDVGVYVIDGSGAIEHTLVRDTRAAAGGFYGDGIGLLGGGASATVDASRIEGSARAGISSFGGVLLLSRTELECNAIHLNAEDVPALADVKDLGGNSCGCAGSAVVCAVLTSNLEPAAQLDEGDR